MKQQVFRFLKSYSTETLKVDRLIISAYLQINKIEVIHNRFIKSYIISEENETEYQSLLKFIKKINKEVEIFNIEELIELFEFVISPSDRIVNGAVYTPHHIREYITQNAFKEITEEVQNIKVADISCGCGGFLLTASQLLKEKTKLPYKEIFRNNIYGIDIQPYSTTRTRILLSLLAIQANEDEKRYKFNLYTADSLTFNWREHIHQFRGFDIIVGNPPYVCARNLPEETLTILKTFNVCSFGNTDLYIPFFQLGVDNLATGGILGFITMNSFFKSLNGRKLRELFQSRRYNFKIIDFGAEQVFRSKNTYTCICLIKNELSEFLSYIRTSSELLPTTNNMFNEIPYIQLDAKTGWNLNAYENIRKLEATGTRFGKLFNTRHGIATLKNDIYIFKPVQEDDDFFYLQNGQLYPIEKAICRDIVNTNLLSREVTIDDIREKIIFPYTNDNKPRLLEEAFFQENFPNAYHYLETKREVLAQRDKGKKNYGNWFAFGRTQSLERFQTKMFFPKMSDQIPTYLISDEENLMFYNGQAIVGHNVEELKFIKKILESQVFWYYIRKTSKPYSAEYYSLNGNYISNFGIYDFNEEQKRYIMQEENREKLDRFLARAYNINITD